MNAKKGVEIPRHIQVYPSAGHTLLEQHRSRTRVSGDGLSTSFGEGSTDTLEIQTYMPYDPPRAADNDTMDGISLTSLSDGRRMVPDMEPPSTPLGDSVIPGETAMRGLKQGVMLNEEGVGTDPAPRQPHTVGSTGSPSLAFSPDRHDAVLYKEGGGGDLVEYRYTDASTSLSSQASLSFSWNELLDESFENDIWANYIGFIIIITSRSNEGGQFYGHGSTTRTSRARPPPTAGQLTTGLRHITHPSRDSDYRRWPLRDRLYLSERLRSVNGRVVQLSLYFETQGLRALQWLCKGCTRSRSLGYRRGSTTQDVPRRQGEDLASEKIRYAPLNGAQYTFTPHFSLADMCYSLNVSNYWMILIALIYLDLRLMASTRSRRGR
jgi:hypothetical protein